MLSALNAIVRPSVTVSDGWISQKRLKLVLCNFHPTVAGHPYLSSFCGVSFIQKFSWVPRSGASNKGGMGKRAIFSSFVRHYLENSTRYVHSYY